MKTLAAFHDFKNDHLNSAKSILLIFPRKMKLFNLLLIATANGFVQVRDVTKVTFGHMLLGIRDCDTVTFRGLKLKA